MSTKESRHLSPLTQRKFWGPCGRVQWIVNISIDVAKVRSSDKKFAEREMRMPYSRQSPVLSAVCTTSNVDMLAFEAPARRKYEMLNNEWL